jgi:hypothetical protein
MVTRKSYFKWCSQQKKNREKRGTVKHRAVNTIRNDGSNTDVTMVVPPLDKIRRDKKRKEDTTTTTAPPQPQPAITQTEWPLATEAVCSEFVTTDSAMMLSIVYAAAQAAAGEERTLTDEFLAQAIREARKGSPKQHSAALYRTTVPAVIRNWAAEARAHGC